MNRLYDVLMKYILDRIELAKNLIFLVQYGLHVASLSSCLVIWFHATFDYMHVPVCTSSSKIVKKVNITSRITTFPYNIMVMMFQPKILEDNKSNNGVYIERCATEEGFYSMMQLLSTNIENLPLDFPSCPQWIFLKTGIWVKYIFLLNI